MSHYCARHIIITLLCIIALLSARITIAQDPQFSQFFATRLYINPAFTGNTNTARVSTQFRRQWPLTQGYTTEAIYYDHNIRALNSGLGLSMLQDRQSGGALVYNRVRGMYAYGFKVKRKVNVRFGINSTYNSYNVDLNSFKFTDQILSGASQSSDDYRFSKLQYFDFGFGGLSYGEKWWLGTSVNHFGNQSRRNDVLSNPFPIKYSLHGGYLIPIHKDVRGKFFKSVSLAFHYKHQLKYDQLDFGAYYGFSKTIFGIWYRGMSLLKNNNATPINHDALIFVFGVKHEWLRITYSFDVTISPLNYYTAGAHEVTCQFDLWRNKLSKHKPNSQKEAPCPDFGPGWQSE